MTEHEYAKSADAAAVKTLKKHVAGPSHFSTPLKRIRISSRKSGTGSENVKILLPTMSQDPLKWAMRNELSGYIWESETIVERLLPAEDTLVEAVLQDLKANLLTHDTLFWKKNNRLQQWPSNLVEGVYYYDPLVWLMNYTLDTARERQSNGSQFYHRSLRFSRYGRLTKDGIENARRALKPNIVGCDRDIPPGESIKMAEDIKIPVEIKDCWENMVAQAGMYVRAMVVSIRGQIWTLVIAFNHIDCEFRFLFYHPGGLTSSTPFCLKTMGGWKKFVSAMVGLISVQERHGAGFDVSRDNTHISIPNIGLCEEEELLFGHHTVRGRRTLVCRVKLPQEQPPRQSGSDTRVIPSSYASLINSNRKPKQPAAESIGPKPEICYSEPFILESIGLLAKGILKTSWPLLIRNTEGEMYKDVSGIFGAPEVIHSYNVNSPDGKPYDTHWLIPEDSTYWNVFGDSESSMAPEVRVLTETLFKTEGRSLITATSPYELLEGILHGIIGYANYYSKGWMHRDVSIGNVLLHERTRRPPCTLFQVTSQLNECVGMLIDGDQAIQWRSSEEHAIERSVTLPFLSLRLARAWAYDKPFTHTAIDDLESFLWLLLWCVLCIVEERGSPCIQESEALFTVRSDELRQHVRRYTAITDLKRMVKSHYGSKMCALFLPVMLSWESISEKAEDFADEWGAGNILTDDVFVYFRDYLEVGFSHLLNMPRSWRDVFGT